MCVCVSLCVCVYVCGGNELIAGSRTGIPGREARSRKSEPLRKSPENVHWTSLRPVFYTMRPVCFCTLLISQISCLVTGPSRNVNLLAIAQHSVLIPYVASPQVAP